MVRLFAAQNCKKQRERKPFRAFFDETDDFKNL